MMVKRFLILFTFGLFIASITNLQAASPQQSGSLAKIVKKKAKADTSAKSQKGSLKSITEKNLQTKKQPSLQQSIKPKILAEKSKTLEIPKTEPEESSNLLYIIIGALALVVIVLIMRKGGKEATSTSDQSDAAVDTQTIIEDTESEHEVDTNDDKEDERSHDNNHDSSADIELDNSTEQELNSNKPSSAKVEGSSDVNISIDGNKTVQRLDSIILDNLIDDLSTAEEFWIVEVPEIKQFVQSGVFSEKECTLEHWEDGEQCSLEKEITQTDEAYDYLRMFLVSIGFDEELFAKEKQKNREKQRDEEKQKKKEFSNILDNENELLLFSYALVNENSPLYTANRFGVDQSHRTTLKELYNKGWTIIDIDKTGQSAQLEDFNFIVRVSK
jgi:hypothetical protein